MRKEFIILAVVIVAAAAYLFTQNSNNTHYELPQVDARHAGLELGKRVTHIARRLRGQ